MTNVALTVIGDDRSGLVSTLAGVVAEHGGNWCESQMARLAGKFAGIVLVDLPAERLAAFEAAVQALSDDGLTVTPFTTAAVPAVGDVVCLQLVGHDRPGIVSQISQALASLGITIDDLQTSTIEAPMAGGVLFQADAVVRLPEGVAPEAVRAVLEPLAGELMVDLDLSA